MTARVGDGFTPVNPLELIGTWPVEHVSAALVRRISQGDRGVSVLGDVTRPFRLASISKVFSTWAILVAVEEGSISLDSPIGQSGCTLAHLLSHAGGYGFDGTGPISAPGRRRIYSNTGIELAAAAVEAATGIAFATYVDEAIFQPLNLTGAVMHGSPAHGVHAALDDVIRFVEEISRPTLLSVETVASATSVQFRELAGIVPGVGRFQPCPWGFGVEIHGHKHPHWMGAKNSARAFGHFGGAGTMFWVDPTFDVALIALTDRPFDLWAPDALRLWPELSDAVLVEPNPGSSITV